ncbi:hypothetical protein CFC21_004409 [Triticum aestivum]|uniref:Uncharacterized protein n=2 Tax=Triticum TaxID=4564 RepID=A0A9R0V219_TRITD|nr:uncharacterized protein LOC119348961 [Triticum dicoccoides]XP_044451381.1 uncharacterized protein LOC123182779 [Triticum aestivum]KAF6986680.1 hypothetical protein CFC21_004405 [Triticum aestivum]KAF6986685.1 hypothetical protein CFC21_004409 [Triticum aestivum]VAH11442.1 unnamed protein product [Triticum turgidum subsp. durum]
MVKLATAREARLYGPALAVRRWEYINAGAYMFGTLLLATGLAALCASEGGAGATDAGLAVAAVALAVVAAVNAHDLGAHLAGVDCRVGLARFDPQLGLVELLAPALHAAGCVLAIVGLALQLFSQGEKLERRAADALLAGAVLWLLGSVLSSCQVYERADGRAQLLQSSVQVPVLLGSLLFLVAAALHRRREPTLAGKGESQSESEGWISLCGSVLWVAGALFNVLKVFVMHQSDAPRLEKLRGGAQERLARDREGRVPLVWRSAAPPTELR